MKRRRLFFAALSVFLAAALLPACGGAASSTPAGSAADYKAVVENARPPELNSLDMYAVVTSADDALHDMIFSLSTGLVEDDMERYAVSLGTIITLAYGVAVVLPKPGREQAVIDQLQAYVETQKKAQENYLHDQYEIAAAALIETAPTGEVLLAMCADASVVMAAMQEGLQAA